MKILLTKYILLLFLTVCITESVTAQYFGKNKPRYTKFDFRTLETPHFKLYHYLKEDSTAYPIGQSLEKWYTLHNAILKDSFSIKNPFLLYNNHGDFQQTNAISGGIGVGTGGVTEAFKNRIVLPYNYTKQQTDHVIGHELVHAFQYNLIIRGDSTSIQNLQYLPLFMVEGLAEYLSIGRFDPHTAMWMRDAVINDKLPSFKELANPKFFPYRYGHAFWSFMTGMFGDEIIRPLFENTAIYGINYALDSVTGINHDTLSNIWLQSVKKYYIPFIGDGKERPIGRKILDEDNAGRMNVSPSLSPNGKYLIFLSEKDIFTTELYLAESKSGKIIRKLSSTIKEGHIDALNYIESVGSWSPNSKDFCYVAVKNGRNVLIIKNVGKARIKKEYFIKGVPAFANPSWSPDGKSIVVTGLVQGQSDLYLLNLRNEKVSQLTNNEYAEIQANWSIDGSKILFATDELSIEEGKINGRWTFNPAILDVQSGAIQHIDIFPGANNLNPIFNHTGDILFLSDRDGYRNMYRYNQDSNIIYQLTDFLTGISGISEFSPAITASKKRDRVLYSHYFNGGYNIYKSQSKKLLRRIVDSDDVRTEPALLPIQNPNKTDFVNANLYKIDKIKPISTDSFHTKTFTSKFKMDYASGSTQGGIGTSSLYGSTNVGGGIFFLFSDELGNHKIFTNVGLNGEIYDINGGITYTNLKNRIGWGVGYSHSPLKTGNYKDGFNQRQLGNGQIINTYEQHLNIIRIFNEDFSVFAQYPLSVTHRIEAGTGISYRHFRWDTITNIYTADGFQYLGQERGKIPIEDDLIINGLLFKKALYYNLSTAFVADNSFFGMASPMKGFRYRLGIAKYFGAYDYYSATLDYRQYYWLKPVAFAFRFMHFSQFGKDASSFYPILIGQMGLVRGYDYGTLQEHIDRYGLSFNNLSGSKVAVTGFEVRLPFTGVDRLALIKSNFLMSEIALFIDGGIAFDNYENIIIKEGEPGYYSRPELVFSAGASVRINLFGALIIEPYWAWPLRKNSAVIFGVNLVPGW